MLDCFAAVDVRTPELNIPDFSHARVLVAGDVMLDRYWTGASERISPEAPVPVVHIEDCVERPGGAANVALNVASLGGRVCVLGITGADAAADSLAGALADRGVDSLLVRLSGQATITKLRVLSRHQQLIRLDFEDGFPGLEPAPLLARYRSALAAADVVVLSDYGKGMLRDAPAYIQAANAAGRPVLVDPKGRDFQRYHGATLITPNLSEFQSVVGHCADDTELVERGQRLLQELALSALLITRSEHGMTLLQRDQGPLHLPVHAREVFDVTGAGDTVIATLAAALAAGVTLSEATVLANTAAGLAVARLGAASISTAELRDALMPGPSSVLGEEDLVRATAAARLRGDRVVMTNGCFDILHAGHVRYLGQARALGDRLIVAVNDDHSVSRLKGPERPVNSLADRMQVLAALAAVDWVVPFSEDTPERLIRRVQPDVLVKGGDNHPDQIPGGYFVRRAGGEVRVLEFLPGRSTTGLIDRLRQKPS